MDSVDWQKLSKSERIQKLQDLFLSKKITFPETYYKNEIKEDLVIEYVKRFSKHFYEINPKRTHLLLTAQNELDQKKFISTFIKPINLPFPDLYDCLNCAKYFRDYITYETIKKPYNNLTPKKIVSPTTLLEFQKGDSFDISTLLVSFLIGAGYDAYCVSGFASKSITVNDLKDVMYDNKHWDFEEKKDKTEKKKNISVYSAKMKKKRSLMNDEFKWISKSESQVLEEIIAEEKKAKEEAERKKKLAELAEMRKKKKNRGNKSRGTKKKKTHTDDIEDESEGDDDDDDYDDDKRLHCWVLILPNKRGVEKAFFIEPTNGRKMSITDKNYYKIESVWNHENYWINMQSEENIITSTSGDDCISFVLKDKEKWENIFIYDEDEKLGVEEGSDGAEILDLPLSWVSNIVMSKSQYNMKYPGKKKIIKYKNVLLEKYSPYFRDDLLVKKIIVYDNAEKSSDRKIKEIHSMYKHRKDGLIRRSHVHSSDENGKDIMEDVFEKRDDALKRILIVDGEKNVYEFDHEGRLDGLHTRIEHFDQNSKNRFFHTKIVTKYKNRDDFLEYRSISFDESNGGSKIPNDKKDDDDDENYTIKLTSMDSKSDTEYDQYKVRKMAEKFSRNGRKKDANTDIRKITFLGDRTKVDFHYAENKITHMSREYLIGSSWGDREGTVNIDGADPFMNKIKKEEFYEELKKLKNAEKVCKEIVRSEKDELKKILQQRKREESKVEYVTTIYDTLLNKPDEDELKELEKKKMEEKKKRKEKDILENYIPKNGIGSEKEAFKIYTKVLSKYKDRILARTKIIEDRIKEENEKMNRSRMQFQKIQDQGEKNEEEFVKLLEDSFFKMNILKKRAVQNKYESKEEWKMLQLKLLNDPRLREYLSNRVGSVKLYKK